MKKRRVKFVWGSADAIRGRWHFGLVGFYDRPQRGRQDGLAISVRGLLAWLGVGAVVCYVLGATAVFVVWQRNPYALQTYSDALLYPFRVSAIKAKSGQALIAQGMELMRAQKWHDGAHFLRLGLARFPRDLQARLRLANYYTLSYQRPRAIQVLEEGLTDEYPGRAYLAAVFRMAEEAENFDYIAETAARWTSRLTAKDRAADLAWLLERRFAAFMSGKRYDAALTHAESELTGEVALERQVLALLELARSEDAEKLLAKWRTQPGADLARVTRLEARVLREAKKFETMERKLAELRALAPSSLEPLVYGIVQRAMGGQTTAAQATLDDYLELHGNRLEALHLVAGPLAEIRNVEMLRRVCECARRQAQPTAYLEIMLVQTHVQLGDWESAAAGLETLSQGTVGAESGAIRVWHGWMHRLVEAAASPKPATHAALVEHLRGRAWPAGIFRVTIEALQRAGRTEATREVAALASHAFPAVRWLTSKISPAEPGGP